MIILAIALAYIFGFATAVVAAIAFMNWPAPERAAAPVRYSAIGAGSVVDSSGFGRAPSDWNPIWNPRTLREVRY